jgi:hypothetical protein
METLLGVNPPDHLLREFDSPMVGGTGHGKGKTIFGTTEMQARENRRHYLCDYSQIALRGLVYA